ncbi:hypothetical protein NKG94_04545 [Micromonospora sp. M12]
MTDAHDRPADRRAVRHRLLDHYLSLARDAARVVDEVGSPSIRCPCPPTGHHRRSPTTGPRWPGSPPNSRSCWPPSTRRSPTASTPTPGSSPRPSLLLSRLSRWHDLVAVQAVAVTVAHRRGAALVEALAHRDLALAHIQLRRYGAAHQHLRLAMERYDQAGDRPGRPAPTCTSPGCPTSRATPAARCRTRRRR